MDTCIWSDAFRKKWSLQTETNRNELKELIQEGRVVLLGPIRQEILSGVSHTDQFSSLKERMKAFPDYPIAMEDYEFAAELYNRFRTYGIQGSNTDFLICAIAHKRDLPIFTTDKDFQLFFKHIKINLYSPRAKP